MLWRGSGLAPTPPPSFSNTYSLDFDGVDDYLEITKTTGYTVTSLSMWVKTSALYGVNIETALSSNDDYNQGRDFFIGDTPTTTNEAYIGMWAGAAIRGKTSATGGIPINDGNWHHLVWTYDATAGTSASINMYVDGVNQYSQAANTSWWTREIKYQYFALPKLSNNYFDGNIDEISIWSTVLSGANVATLYNSGTPTDLSTALASTPVGWWRNGDGSTYPTINDEIGSSNATMNNMVSGDIVTDVP